MILIQLWNNMKKIIFILAMLICLPVLGNNMETNLQNILVEHWYKENIAEMIIHQCKVAKVKNVKHCVVVGASIAEAESTRCEYAQWGTNCWGFLWYKFSTKTEAFKRWIKSYKKYWYNAKNSKFFYGTKDNIAPSRYCLSEDSSWAYWRCPNWNKNFNKIFKLFYK